MKTTWQEGGRQDLVALLDAVLPAADTWLMTAPPAFSCKHLAPWAEIVPHVPPMTVDELHAISDDGWAYELIEGVLVRTPVSGFEASNVGLRIGSRLSVYVEDNDLRAVAGEQGGYRLDPAHPGTRS